LESTRKTEKFKKRSIHYFENALHFIEADDLEKASEFLWGSVSQALKAVAASRGIELRSHKKIRDYAMEIAKNLGDDSIRHEFNSAQSLHSNFYESGLILEDVVIGAEDAKRLVAKLFYLIPEEEATNGK
jgi:hypothetical protein